MLAIQTARSMMLPIIDGDHRAVRGTTSLIFSIPPIMEIPLIFFFFGSISGTITKYTNIPLLIVKDNTKNTTLHSETKKILVYIPQTSADNGGAQY